jgi:quinol monooxygenase YgiN
VEGFAVSAAPFVVIVDFRIHAAHRDPFLRAMADNARASLEREPGCRQFDVCTDPAQLDAVFLYEVYDDRAAFDAHLAAPHFLAFDRLVAPWIASKAVRTLQRMVPS